MKAQKAKPASVIRLQIFSCTNWRTISAARAAGPNSEVS